VLGDAVGVVGVGTDGEFDAFFFGPVENERIGVDFVDALGQAAGVDFHAGAFFGAGLQEGADFRFKVFGDERIGVDGAVDPDHIRMRHAVVESGACGIGEVTEVVPHDGFIGFEFLFDEPFFVDLQLVMERAEHEIEGLAEDQFLHFVQFRGNREHFALDAA